MNPSIRCLASAGAFLATATLAQAQVGLKAHGPLNQYGFPSYYQDHADLRLTQCIDQNDPLCGIPVEDHLVGPLAVNVNPALSNFYHESFYWNGLSTLNIPNRGEAILIMAIEGVFGNADEAIIDGDQVVFSRLRIRLRGDAFEGGFYRIDTPYGTFDFNAPPVDPGRRIVNHTVDCLHVIQPPPAPQFICGPAPDGPGANFFSTPLGILDDGTPAPEVAPNGPFFLSWDPGVLPLAPQGYIGDPALLHPVVGAVAPNQNRFRVRYSPNGNFNNPVFDASTDLFSISGKVEPGDPCDGQAPVAAFGASPTSGFAPLGVNFTDQSTCATEWEWDFGDGGSSAQQNPSHVYTAPGLYTVSLTVNGPGGTDIETKVDLISVQQPTGNELVLANPVPGTAGVVSSYRVSGARPNAQVGVYIGSATGASSVNLGNCGGIPIGIARPFRLLGRARASAAGIAVINAATPAGAAGRTFFFQAIEPVSCRSSNLVTEVF